MGGFLGEKREYRKVVAVCGDGGSWKEGEGFENRFLGPGAWWGTWRGHVFVLPRFGLAYYDVWLACCGPPLPLARYYQRVVMSLAARCMGKDMGRMQNRSTVS